MTSPIGPTSPRRADTSRTTGELRDPALEATWLEATLPETRRRVRVCWLIVCMAALAYVFKDSLSLSGDRLLLLVAHGGRRPASAVSHPIRSAPTTISFQDPSVPTSLQTVRAVAGFLGRAAQHCTDTGGDPDEVVHARLFADIAHFRLEAAKSVVLTPVWSARSP